MTGTCFWEVLGSVSAWMPLAVLIEEHTPPYATVKNWVAQFKRGEFSTCDAPRPGRPKTVTTPEIIDQIH